MFENKQMHKIEAEQQNSNKAYVLVDQIQTQRAMHNNIHVSVRVKPMSDIEKEITSNKNWSIECSQITHRRLGDTYKFGNISLIS